ncbi:hypothetical protein F4824DRAFT_243363 [Ustulina deusta]|nr:hypothetical protein F4824DRAFT_243363 [Ustulina deusta]
MLDSAGPQRRRREGTNLPSWCRTGQHRASSQSKVISTFRPAVYSASSAAQTHIHRDGGVSWTSGIGVRCLVTYWHHRHHSTCCQNLRYRGIIDTCCCANSLGHLC